MFSSSLHSESSSVQLNESQDFDVREKFIQEVKQFNYANGMMIAYLQEPFERLSKFVKRRGCYDLHKAGLYFITVALLRHFSSNLGCCCPNNHSIMHPWFMINRKLMTFQTLYSPVVLHGCLEKTQTSKTQTPRKLRCILGMYYGSIMVTIRSFPYQSRPCLSINSTGSSGYPQRILLLRMNS